MQLILVYTNNLKELMSNFNLNNITDKTFYIDNLEFSKLSIIFLI